MELWSSSNTRVVEKQIKFTRTTTWHDLNFVDRINFISSHLILNVPPINFISY